MPEIYRIETVGPEEEGSLLIRRTLVRVDTEETAKKRALHLFEKARRPQARGARIETVRVLNGAGYEVFSVSTRD